MVTDELIKSEFIHSVVSRDIHRIYETQEKVVRENFPSGTGSLAAFLSLRPFTVGGEGDMPIYYMRIFSYLRFLDIRYSSRAQMKTRRRLALYNRVIWGVLYNETIGDLHYGFSARIRDRIRTDLEQAGGESSTELRASWAKEI